MDASIKLELTQREWETLRDGTADIACWFMGFKAAHVDTCNLELPPQLTNLIDLLSSLKARVNNAS